MNTTPEGASARLREEFDAAFALPRPPPAPAGQAYVAITLRGAPHALSLGEISGIERAGRIAPLPAPAAALVGLAAIRGELVPVWDLGTLLDLEGARPEPGWLVLAGTSPRIALAFDGFEGLVTAAADAIQVGPQGARTLRTGSTIRPIVAVERALERVRTLCGSNPAPPRISEERP